ncbi:phage portal protein, partial [Escherichia coli]|uniref:phage portal protein n=1 Tax=Escherichia coli TaxID=562 RepID=UPI0038601EF4
GFGGQMAEWLPPAQSADAALLPALRLGNARADDLVRNNGIAANAVALHKDHIVGHMFLISYRPNWRWLGMRETAAKSFVDEVEAAWSEYAEGMSGEIDVEEKRTFTEFIREGVGVHAFNGEIFVQPVWDTESTQLFRTRFKAVSPKRVDTPGHGTDGALITGLTFLDPKDATQVQGLFQHLQVRFGDGPWQDVKGLDEVGSDTGRTGE